MLVDSAAMLANKMPAVVAPQVNLRNLLHTGEKAHEQEMHHDFETHSLMSPETKIGVLVA